MEIKKSTVKQVQASGTWDGKFGVMYKYEVLMTNGDAGQYLSKSQSQDKFIQGGVVDYQFTSGDFPKIKPHFEQNYGDKFGVQKPVSQSLVVKQQTNDTQTQIIRQSSIRTAAEHCKGNCSIEDLIYNAEMIFDWCVDGSKPTISNEKPF
tara:strand:+ start:2305 stop:2754 length:450 start_codon:yes stop_codon:yes gene_type:complete